MGSVVQLVRAMASPLAQHHRVREGGDARGDVDRRAPGEVETAHLVAPSQRAPGPAGDRIVNEGGPDEHEDDAGKHPAALGNGTRSQGHGDGREHALVEREEQVRDAGRAD